MNRFFVDAETDGLYGRFLSIAALVTDENGRELDRFYGAVRAAADEIESDWVREHVLPGLENAAVSFACEHDLLETFWAFWIKHRETAECIAYVPYPVESRLFLSCVLADRAHREFLAPFPLYDLGTLLAAHGIDPDVDMPGLSGMELKSHDAMNDVIMMAAVWNQLL